MDVKPEMDGLRRAVAELLDEDPDTWPAHGNAPLAIASAVALLVRNQTALVEARPYAGVVLWSGDREVRLIATREQVERTVLPNATLRSLCMSALYDLEKQS